MTSKRTPEDILSSIEDPPIDEEIERVLAMTPEERRAELAAAGIDIKELHAQADALRAKPLRPRAPRWRTAALLAAAAVAVAGIGGAIHALVGGTIRQPPAAGFHDAAAATVREQGLAACGDHRWQECLDDLDRARDLDPAGDAAPQVQQARALARQAMAGDAGRDERPR
jgi:hypothetical protein